MNDFTRLHYATVDDMIVALTKLSVAGKGHYIVGCNEEYWLARKGDSGNVDDNCEMVDFGGYTG